jgi:hypothetical protein
MEREILKKATAFFTEEMTENQRQRQTGKRYKSPCMPSCGFVKKAGPDKR